MKTGTLPFTSSTISGRIWIVERPVSARPPWLETWMKSIPCRMQSAASSVGSVQASFARADARDRLTGESTPEGPRLIWDVLATADRLPFHLQARGEYEHVGRKPLGDGFIAVSVRGFRGALIRPFESAGIAVGVNFHIVSGYGGQTLETLALPGEGGPFERITVFPLRSYLTASLTYRFQHLNSGLLPALPPSALPSRSKTLPDCRRTLRLTDGGVGDAGGPPCAMRESVRQVNGKLPVIESCSHIAHTIAIRGGVWLKKSTSIYLELLRAGSDWVRWPETFSIPVGSYRVRQRSEAWLTGARGNYSERMYLAELKSLRLRRGGSLRKP
jgi:hypothetical protein